MMYYRVRQELSVSENSDVLLRGQRIVIPQSLQKRVINLAHEGHQGLVRTKQLLREKVWFVNIDKLVAKMIESCLACQCTVPDISCPEYSMSPLPKSVWCEVSIDFKHVKPNEYLLVIMDDMSRYPVVEPVKSTSISHVLPVLDRIFSMFGVPEIVKSDNGPPFHRVLISRNLHYILDLVTVKLHLIGIEQTVNVKGSCGP